MRPFGCPVTILNTIDHLGKFYGKTDEGFFVGYSLNSKAFRVPNLIVLQSSHDDGSKPSSDDGKKVDEDPRKESECNDQEKEDNVNSTNNVNAVGTNEVNAVGGKTSIELPLDPNMPALEDYNIFDFSRDDEDDDAVADMNNLDTTIQVSHIPTIRIHKYHSLNHVIGDLRSATQTRKISKNLEEHGYTQEEGIDYDEVFATFARIKAIRLFLAYASFKDFIVYQMDVISAFLYGKIEEEVYVCQPPGFEDPDFPDKVYKVEKALYGLHQAPRAWYETLSTYLLDNGFQRGKFIIHTILQCLSPKTTAWNEFSSTMASSIICLATNQKFNFSKLIFDSMIRNLDNVFGKILMYPRKPKNKDTQVPQPSDSTKSVADEAVHKELCDSLVRAATTASSLEAEQDSGGGHRCQVTMGDIIAQTRVLDLEKTKTTQHNEIASFKRRIKKLEKKNRSRTYKLKRLYKVGLRARVESFDDEESLGEDASKQGRIDASDADKEITLVSVHDEMEVDEEVVEVINTTKLIIDVAQVSAAGDKVSAASAATTVSAATTTTATTVDNITLAQALEEMKSTKPKTKGVVIQELGESTTTKSSQLSLQQSHDKFKGIWIEPVKLMKKKDQISFDEETALKLQVEFDEEERLAREKAEKEQEANISLIETWDDIQAKIDVNHQLAERCKHKNKKSSKRAEEIRNKPPTKAQQRTIMCTYLKNMEGYKLKYFKSKGFDSIQEIFDRAFKRVNTFEDFRTELVEGKEKRAGAELVQKSTKKQKVEDDK
ncbi:retrovirus-related pol polyprotein from transposon TNT 1-94 [Tanacetum coccineum]